MATFSLSRGTHINAAPEQVRAHLDDFHRWTAWSPWEGLDPDMQRTYLGPDAGVGARYEWHGNSKAGEGAMTITDSGVDKVVCDVEFLKPFKARNVSRFDLAPSGDGTAVTWTMTGRQNPLLRLMGRLFFDKAIAKDFDRGLAGLKAVAEQP